MMELTLGEDSIDKELQAVAILHSHGLLDLLEAYQNRGQAELAHHFDWERGSTWHWSTKDFSYWFPVCVKYKLEPLKQANTECLKARCYATCQLLRDIKIWQKTHEEQTGFWLTTKKNVLGEPLAIHEGKPAI